MLLLPKLGNVSMQIVSIWPRSISVSDYLSRMAISSLPMFQSDLTSWHLLQFPWASYTPVFTCNLASETTIPKLKRSMRHAFACNKDNVELIYPKDIGFIWETHRSAHDYCSYNEEIITKRKKSYSKVYFLSITVTCKWGWCTQI